MPIKICNSEDLENEVEDHVNSSKIKVLVAKCPHMPRRTITDRDKRKKKRNQFKIDDWR